MVGDGSGGRRRLSVRVPRPDVVEVAYGGEVVGRYGGDVGRFVLRPAGLSPADCDVLPELVRAHRCGKSHMTDGVAASYYGVSDVGTMIHRCKYEGGGHFPDRLLGRTLKVFCREFGGCRFDVVMYVPPTKSGDLVRDFALRFSRSLGLRLSDGLRKARVTGEQKFFQNKDGKKDNVVGAFELSEDVRGKRVVVVDDIYDSGETLRELGRLLTSAGADYVVPVVIAKTVGGTL